MADGRRPNTLSNPKHPNLLVKAPILPEGVQKETAIKISLNGRYFMPATFSAVDLYGAMRSAKVSVWVATWSRSSNQGPEPLAVCSVELASPSANFCQES